ncbi:hypothetical protein [Methylocystis echinoides]|uniref:Uncharacterized protein n=1 Tax=Methylocystis echinoides TaxID=29468 RepID=A0A9W6GXW3_9HYPH|nr:hypothetical protein [Methylocystis echinoides]GLI94879.1 hypothetical protein LMG27198_38710 [Methylocystis echinoides]
MVMLNAPAFLDSLKSGVDFAGDVTVIGGAIGLVLILCVLVRDA